MFLRSILALLLVFALQTTTSQRLAAASTQMEKPGSNGFIAGLIDQNGKPVSRQRFAGKPTLLHFGFTHCPEVCPTTLNEIANLMAKLGPKADRINFVFATVDPERDTPEVLKEYIGHFDERIVGLTGSVTAITALAKSFNTSFAKRAYDGGYTMDHAIFAYLKDRYWQTVGTLYMGVGANSAFVQKKMAILLGNSAQQQK